LPARVATAATGWAGRNSIAACGRRCRVAENNGNGSGPHAVEFALALHVYKQIGDNGRPDLYLIAVWEGTTLMPLCHLEPLDIAMEKLRERLANAGKTPALQTT
jgi:hypothetical protein